MKNRNKSANQPECVAEKRLLAQVVEAFGHLIEIQGCQVAALGLGDRDLSRFEEEVELVLQSWKHALRAYIQHVQDHRC